MLVMLRTATMSTPSIQEKVGHADGSTTARTAGLPVHGDSALTVRSGTSSLPLPCTGSLRPHN